jgi:hypothetical protein
MRKLLFLCMVFLGAAVMAAPAMASDFKMTMSGEMEVNAYLIKSTVQGTSSAAGDSTNAWYQQSLEVKPIFHINEDIRIHNKVVIHERDWGGTQGGAVAYAPGTLDANTVEPAAVVATGGPTGGDQMYGHNFWWEQCYMSFPLSGGHLYVGRMPGGGWAYDFMDDDDNRDRIKYVKKSGHNVFVFVLEKLEETDGGNNGNNVYNNSDSDVDALALGAVIPFSKDFIIKPLLYYVDYGSDSVTLGAPGVATAFPEGCERYYIFLAPMYKKDAFKLDAEFIYIWDTRGAAPGAVEVEGEQLLYWLDASINKGPSEFALGHYYLQGEDNATGGDNERNSLYGLGNAFEPLLLMHSQDLGLYNDSMGVANGSAVGASGFMGLYLRGAHQISDDKKISCILGWLKADEMLAGSGAGTATADDELGKELDITFEWNFMPNITYTAAFAYFMTGDYYDDTDGSASQDLTNDPYAVLNRLTIDW